MSVAKNLSELKASLPDAVTLVAVSKTKPIALLQEAYDVGQRIFGENRVQEIVEKAAELPTDIQWHFIGHLQSKKVKNVVPIAALIHSVDSEKLLEEINKRSEQHKKITDCLLQVYIAQEETKYGFSAAELRQLFASAEFAALKNVRIVGLMGMATFTSDTAQVRAEFASLKALYEELKATGPANVAFTTLSMGMSGDYKIAIAEGSNMIRVGSAIFGTRG